MSVKTIILHNIVSSNSVYKLKIFIKHHRKELGSTEVWFCAETESNRRWQLQEKITFKYKVLAHQKMELNGQDLFTYFINPSIWRELNKAHPDRLIINGWDQFAYQLAFLWGKVHRKKITLWTGSTIFEPSWRRTLAMPMVKTMVLLADDYLAYGKRAKSYLKRLGAPAHKIKIWLNDVHQSYFQRQALKLKKKRGQLLKKHRITTKHNFIFVGQLIERKGVWDLIKAYRLATHHQHKPWGLMIIGYGQLALEIKNYVRTHHLTNVYLFDHIEQYNLPEYYAMADCLVLPSHEEVWGLVVNEALASGLQVIVSHICGCVPDLVLPNPKGKVYAAGNILSLTCQMKKVLSP